jgi:hypothetical protein
MVTFHVSRRAVFLVVLGILLAIPAGSWASHRFTDVPDTNIFHDDISWLADAGVTRGCNPPDNDEFCPDDFVTRQQLAAFLRRLSTSSVVDAGTLDGFDSSDFLGVADNSTMGYVWACEPFEASYDPADSCTYARNSSGGSISIARESPGRYSVTFAGLGRDEAGGHAQVSAYGTNPRHCQVVRWDLTADVTVQVVCFDSAGVEADAPFDLLFVW